MNKTLYVLISGKRLSGKDTLAQSLYNRLLGVGIESKYSTVVTHLADAIRHEVMRMFPDDITDISQIQDNNSPIKEKYRPFLISVGQEGRAQSVDFWCAKVHEDMQEQGANIVLIPDVRFPNEVEYFAKQLNAITYTIRLDVAIPELVRRGWKFEAGKDDDVSETSLDLSFYERPWDLYIYDIGYECVLFPHPNTEMQSITEEASIENIANKTFGYVSNKIITEGTP